MYVNKINYLYWKNDDKQYKSVKCVSQPWFWSMYISLQILLSTIKMCGKEWGIICEITFVQLSVYSVCVIYDKISSFEKIWQFDFFLKVYCLI